ncbi:MAG: hypothetical protein ACREE2_16060 [Stellaceae bacterium]
MAPRFHRDRHAIAFATDLAAAAASCRRVRREWFDPPAAGRSSGCTRIISKSARGWGSIDDKTASLFDQPPQMRRIAHPEQEFADLEP